MPVVVRKNGQIVVTCCSSAKIIGLIITSLIVGQQRSCTVIKPKTEIVTVWAIGWHIETDTQGTCWIHWDSIGIYIVTGKQLTTDCVIQTQLIRRFKGVVILCFRLTHQYHLYVRMNDYWTNPMTFYQGLYLPPQQLNIESTTHASTYNLYCVTLCYTPLLTQNWYKNFGYLLA